MTAVSICCDGRGQVQIWGDVTWILPVRSLAQCLYQGPRWMTVTQSQHSIADMRTNQRRDEWLVNLYRVPLLCSSCLKHLNKCIIYLFLFMWSIENEVMVTFAIPVLCLRAGLVAVMVVSLGGGVSVSHWGPPPPLISLRLLSRAQFSSYPPLLRPGPQTNGKQKNLLLLKEQTIRWSFCLSRVFSQTWSRCGSRRSNSQYLRGQSSPLRLRLRVAVCSEQFYNQFDNVWINTELWSNPLRQI